MNVKSAYTFREYVDMDVSEQDLERPPTSSREEIVADLERKIEFRTGGRIRGLRLEEVGDAIVLSGRTSTYYVKQLASQIALDECLTLNFENSIEVV